MNDVFLPYETLEDKNRVLNQRLVSPYRNPKPANLINIVLKVKNSTQVALGNNVLEDLVKKHLEKAETSCKITDQLLTTQTNKKTTQLTDQSSLKINIEKTKSVNCQEICKSTIRESLSSNCQRYVAKNSSREILEKILSSKKREISSTQKLAAMDLCSEEDQFMFINFDHLLDDISDFVNDESFTSGSNDILDQIFADLGSVELDQESALLQSPESTSPLDLDLPDLSELPLEDFADIESFINDSECVAVTNDEIEDVVKSDFCPDFDIEDIIMESFSEQSSPSVDTALESEYNELLDSVFDSNFMQELQYPKDNYKEILKVSDATELNQITDIVDTSFLYSLSNTNETATFVKAGTKRDSSHTTKSSNELTLKRVKKDTEVSPLYLCPKENETEKDTIRRIKNNEASRVTRAKRKTKHSGLFKKQTELEKSNAQLKVKIEVMQKEADVLRELLVARLSSASK